MINLTPDFKEASKNINAWRQRYQPPLFRHQDYPHKIVVNMMYRAYTTRAVFEDFKNDILMDDFDDFVAAFGYVKQQYEEKAREEIHANLLNWMKFRPNEQVGTLTTANYESLATRAESDKKALEELEFSYIFEMLCDMCVLYFIAFKLCGMSDEEAIEKLSNYQVELQQELDYTGLKVAFRQLPLFLPKFVQDNYIPFN